MAERSNGAAGRGATDPRAYSVSLQQAAAAIFGISPTLNHAGAPSAPSPAQHNETTGKISEP